MVGKATPDRGGPRKSPDGVDPKTSGWASKRTRKTQRDGHNSGVKIWSLCSVSSILSHANPWTTISDPCNKMRGKMLLKKSSCVFLQAFSFMRLSLMLCRCDAWTCKWLYNTYIKHTDRGINHKIQSKIRSVMPFSVYHGSLFHMENHGKIKIQNFSLINFLKTFLRMIFFQIIMPTYFSNS